MGWNLQQMIFAYLKNSFRKTTVIHAIFDSCNSYSTLSTLDYLIAVGYQINIALGIFPEIDKRSLLNNCSLGKNFKKLNEHSPFDK